jgi:hypothetical protein
VIVVHLVYNYHYSKINWDAALDRQNKLMGVGLITGDHLGGVRVSLSTVISYIYDPEITKAYCWYSFRSGDVSTLNMLIQWLSSDF